MDFKNGLPGVDSIFFNTVTTHQSFFLIVLQTRKELVTKKGVTMHSSIISFACFIYFKSLSVLSLRLFRTFLYSLSRNGAMFQMFLTFELPKLTFSTDQDPTFSNKFEDLCY